MKALGIVAIALGLASIGFNLYAVMETLPNYEYMHGIVTSGQIQTEFDIPLRDSLRDTLKMQAYAAFGLGVLAAICGIVGGIKKFLPAWAGVLLGLAGLIWQFTWAV